MENIDIRKGWDTRDSSAVAELYEEAFGRKFAAAISDRQKRVEILSKSFVPDFSYAVYVDDKIAGLAGFQTRDGSLTGGLGLSGLIRELGLVKGVWAGLVLALLERQPKSGELVMGGIVVDTQYRSCGLGSRLLDVIVAYAADNGFHSVRLDVINSNPRARKLYEAKGFVTIKEEYFPYLKWLIGFSGSATMQLKVP